MKERMTAGRLALLHRQLGLGPDQLRRRLQPLLRAKRELRQDTGALR